MVLFWGSNIIGLAVLVLLLLFRATKTIETVETVLLRDTIFDTITVQSPPSKIVEKIRDTIIYIDTSQVKADDDEVLVTMPLNRYLFEETGRYKLELEGIAVKPIKFELIHPTITNTITNTVTKQERLSWGVFGGVGVIYGAKGIDVGLVVGVGLQYRF